MFVYGPSLLAIAADIEYNWDNVIILFWRVICLEQTGREDRAAR